jgi:acyl carrier protein
MVPGAASMSAEPPTSLQVIEVLRSVIPGSPELDEGTELLGSGLVDSLSLVALVAGLEARFGIVLPPEVLVPETFETPVTVRAVVVESISAASR